MLQFIACVYLYIQDHVCIYFRICLHRQNTHNRILTHKLQVEQVNHNTETFEIRDSSKYYTLTGELFLLSSHHSYQYFTNNSKWLPYSNNIMMNDNMPFWLEAAAQQLSNKKYLIQSRGLLMGLMGGSVGSSIWLVSKHVFPANKDKRHQLLEIAVSRILAMMLHDMDQWFKHKYAHVQIHTYTHTHTQCWIYSFASKLLPSASMQQIHA